MLNFIKISKYIINNNNFIKNKKVIDYFYIICKKILKFIANIQVYHIYNKSNFLFIYFF